MARRSRRGSTPSRLFKLMGRKSRTREFVPLEQEEEEAAMKNSAAPDAAKKPSASVSDNEAVMSHPWDKHLPASRGMHLKKKRFPNVVWKDEGDGSTVEEGESLADDSFDSGNFCSEDDDLDARTYKTNSDESGSSEDEDHLPMSPKSVVDFVSLSPDTFKDCTETKQPAFAYNDDETDSGSSVKQNNMRESPTPVSLSYSHADDTRESCSTAGFSPDRIAHENCTSESDSPEGLSSCQARVDETAEIPISGGYSLPISRVEHMDDSSESPPLFGESPKPSEHVENIDQISAPVGNTDVPFDETPFDEIHLGEIPFDELPFDELGSCRGISTANKQPVTVRDFNGFNAPIANKQPDTLPGFNGNSVSTAKRQPDILRGYNGRLSVSTAKKQPDFEQDSNGFGVSTASKQPDIVRRFNGPSVSTANKEPDFVRGFKAPTISVVVVGKNSSAAMGNQSDEDIPFDELEGQVRHIPPMRHTHNFEDKTYFSDDDGDSLYTEEFGFERTISSVASGDDDGLFGLEFLAHS